MLLESRLCGKFTELSQNPVFRELHEESTAEYGGWPIDERAQP